MSPPLLIFKQKIKDKEQEINQKKAQLENLRIKAEKIERKVRAMKKFESFLEEVKESNQDEFSELSEILSRYDTLKQSNDKLHENHKDKIEEIDTLTRRITNEKKLMTIEKMTINNQIAK